MKKTLILLLSLLLAFSLALPAFATEEAQTETPAGEDTQAPQPSEGSCETLPPATTHTHSWTTVTNAATCTAEGSKVSTCSCGETATEVIPATGHTYGGWVNVDTATHKHTCTVCAAEETAAHGWGEGTVNVQATCTTQGQKTYTCACGAVKTETLAVTDHAWGEWVLTEESHSRTCSGCGKNESGSHYWGVTETVAPTCKEEGGKIYGCTTCGGVLVELIPKLTTHTYDHGCDTDCNICGATRVTQHNYNKAWSRNSSQHWHACTICGDKGDLGSHYPGPAATEEKAQLCLTCGLTMTPKLNHTHDYESKWSFDETSHWYACDGCEEMKDLDEHTYDDPCDPDCNVCGYTTATAHSYGDEWESDEEGHWAICTLCGEESEIKDHVPGPEATDTEPQLCTVCGYELAPAQVHVHEFGEEWLSDEENHWHVCQCGELSEPLPHTWDEGREEDDMLLYKCTECDALRMEEAPKAGFPWWLLLVALAVVVLGGAVTVLVLNLRKQKPSGKYSK